MRKDLILAVVVVVAATSLFCPDEALLLIMWLSMLLTIAIVALRLARMCKDLKAQRASLVVPVFGGVAVMAIFWWFMGPLAVKVTPCLTGRILQVTLGIISLAMGIAGCLITLAWGEKGKEENY